MYYLVNVTSNKRLSFSGTSVNPGGRFSFTEVTAEILLSVQRGDVRVYHADTHIEEFFTGWVVQEITTPLDPAIAAGLPPSMRVPTVSYVVVEPEAPGDPLELYVPDATLRGILNLRLGIFRAAELAYYIRPMRLSGLGITDARGLQNAMHIEEFDLSDNPITTIGDLSRMSKLKLLDLSGCDLSVVTGIAKLEQLEQLRLQGNSLSSIGSLKALRLLSEVDVRNNILPQAAVDQIIDDLWLYRYEVGRRNALIRLEGNAAPSAMRIQKIEGTGAYEYEGLKQMGCLVTYTAP